MPDTRKLAKIVAAGAACKDMPTDLFYPVGISRGRGAWLQIDPAALAACAACPVKEQCLALGMARREQGVWGGQLLSPWRPGTIHRKQPERNDPVPGTYYATVVEAKEALV